MARVQLMTRAEHRCWTFRQYPSVSQHHCVPGRVGLVGGLVAELEVALT